MNKKTLFSTIAASVLAVGAVGGLALKNNNIFLTSGESQTGTFVFNETTNMWGENDTFYTITSTNSVTASAKVADNWDSTISKKAGTFAHVALDELESSSQAWFVFQVKGAVSISWVLDQSISFNIELLEVTSSGGLSFCSGVFGPNGLACSGQTGSADFSEASDTIQIVYVKFSGAFAEVTEFDVISFELTYSVDNCWSTVDNSAE